jgi:ABC-2 type transport system permease protein
MNHIQPWIIAKQEFSQLLQSRLNRILILLAWVLLLFSGWLEAEKLQDSSMRHQEVSRKERAFWTEQPDRNPHRAAHFGQFAFRRPDPLEVFESGVLPYSGSAVFIEAHVRHEPILPPFLSAPPPSRFGYFQINTILNMILPLLLIFLGAPRIPFEGSGGILKILKSQGLSDHQILFGKTLGLFGVAGLCFDLPLFLLGSILSSGLELGLISNLSLLLLVQAFYHLICSAGVILVSSLARSETGALGLTMAAFLALSFVAPRILLPWTDLSKPATGLGTMKKDLYESLARAPDGHQPGSPEFETLKRDFLAQQKADRLEDLSVNFEALVLQRAEESTSRIYHQAFEKIWRRWLEQDEIAVIAGFFSPPYIQRVLSMHLARSHLQNQKHFEESVESHRASWVKTLNQLLYEVPYGSRKEHKAGRSAWEKIPSFQGEFLDLSRIIRNSRLGWLVILSQTSILLVLLRNRRLSW